MEDYKQKFEELEKLLKDLSSGITSIYITSFLENETEELKKYVKSKDYAPYYNIQDKLNSIEKFNQALLEVSDKLAGELTPEHKEYYTNKFQELDKQYFKLVYCVEEMLKLFKWMGIVDDYHKSTDDNFWIQWTHGYEPIAKQSWKKQ